MEHTGTDILSTVAPVIALLFLGVAAAVASRALRLSPIVGYLVLGLALKASGLGLAFDGGVISILAELGVVFLLFDIGLHFSLSHVREQAKDIFGFGPVQVILGTLGLGALALLAGLPPLGAFFVGATLALSSTAVVAGLIAERRQQNCPVGLTATAILIFQDVAAIFILIVATALDGGAAAMLPAAGLAIVKAVGAFVIAVVLARVVVRPVFNLIARGDNEEVFTASALLVALAAGWATGAIGLSLTLGAFLGGMIVAETPYRPIVQSEIKPFRGLLLGFFFISVGLSLDPVVLSRAWPAVIGVAVVLVAAKVVLNAGASLLFRWSVPGSTQLGFLLSQGSEFAFVVFSLPALRNLLGQTTMSVLVAAVALSLAATPTLAQVGRDLAGRMRRRKARLEDPELQEQGETAPVLIVGMGTIGRTVADALSAFDIAYAAIERDPQRLQNAVADGYEANFGDPTDPRIWEPVGLSGRRIIALTAPRFEISSALAPAAQSRYPNLRRMAAVADEAERERWAGIGVLSVVDRSTPRGLDFASAVLDELGVDADKIAEWMRLQQQRALPGRAGAAFTAAAA